MSQASARTRTIRWDEPLVDPREIAALSGIEYLQSLIDARQIMPIAALMDITLERVAAGIAVFAGVPSDFHYNPIGSVHGGFAATLLDSALGCAVHTTLAAGFGYTTVELKVNYVRALRASTGRVVCEGRVIHVGKRLATAEARVVDTEGRLYAHGSTTCLILPQSASP